MWGVCVQGWIHLFHRSCCPLRLLSWCCCCRSWVHCDCWKHLRWAEGKEHGVHGCAVKLVEVETGQFRIGVCVNLVFLVTVRKMLWKSWGRNMPSLFRVDYIVCMLMSSLNTGLIVVVSHPRRKGTCSMTRLRSRQMCRAGIAWLLGDMMVSWLQHFSIPISTLIIQRPTYDSKPLCNMPPHRTHLPWRNMRSPYDLVR